MATFTKYYEPNEFDDELTKARLLHACSVGASFSSPAVMVDSVDRGAIEYEHLDCSTSLMDALSAKDRSRDSILGLLSVVGGSLALIHQIAPPVRSVNFQRSQLFSEALAARSEGGGLTEAAAGPSGSKPSAPHPGVLQHGDFGFTNVFVRNQQDLIVIDPSPNQYLSVHPLNVDHPELDLAILVSHLVGRASSPVALGRSAMFGRPMVDAVVAGYELAGAEINRDRLRLYTRAGIDAVRQYASDGSLAHRRAILKPISAVLARNI